MFTLMIVIFVIGYLAIALEHPIKVDKAASALLTGVFVWTVYILSAETLLHIPPGGGIVDYVENTPEALQNEGFLDYLKTIILRPGETMTDLAHGFVVHDLLEHISEIASILFFLMGAMTIVELIDAHEGFSIITDKIKTTNKVKLLWILSILTFFLSAALDNLTTSIVMCALLRKLIKDRNDQLFFAGMVVISANAGGAWSPIGDVTTIMLWIGGQITALSIVVNAFLPSLICVLLPLILLSFTQKGEIERPDKLENGTDSVDPASSSERLLVLCMGVGSLLFVPVFKTLTHLPPFMGILLGLGVLWVTTEILHRSKNHETRSRVTVYAVLRRIDTSSVMFFLGILTAVGALQSAGHLRMLAEYLKEAVGNEYIINIIIGFLSSVIDNVPLVAGAMGMYDITPTVIHGIGYPVDNVFWQFLAYCAGVGGSCLIIGSAAGVATMGIMKIDFIWYLKKMSLLALFGYLGGGAFYWFFEEILHLGH